MRFLRTPFSASAQQGQLVDNGDLPLQIPIALGGQSWIKEGLGETRALLKGILDWGQRRLNWREEGIIDC